MVIHQCYQALGNAMSRRDHERSENARLIEKKNRIDSFAKSLKEQGQSENEIKEMVCVSLVPMKLSKVLKGVDFPPAD